MKRPLLTSDTLAVLYPPGSVVPLDCVIADQDSNYARFPREIEFRVFLWILLQDRSVVTNTHQASSQQAHVLCGEFNNDPFRRCALALSSRSVSATTFLVDAWDSLLQFLPLRLRGRLFHCVRRQALHLSRSWFGRAGSNISATRSTKGFHRQRHHRLSRYREPLPFCWASLQVRDFSSDHV